MGLVVDLTTNDKMLKYLNDRIIKALKYLMILI